MSYSQLPSRLPTKEPSIIDFRDIVGKYLMQAGVLDDDWPDWEDAVWLALTDGGEAEL